MFIPKSFSPIPPVFCSDFDIVYAIQNLCFPDDFFTKNSAPYALDLPFNKTVSISLFVINQNGTVEIENLKTQIFYKTLMQIDQVFEV